MTQTENSTPLRAGISNGRGWTYNAVLLRGKTVDERCPHGHKTRRAAQECARRGLGRRIKQGRL